MGKASHNKAIRAQHTAAEAKENKHEKPAKPWWREALELVLLAAALARRFIAPLYAMKDTAEAFRSGHYERRTGLTQNDELGLLAESLDELGRRLGEAETERNLLQRQRQEFLAAVSHELRTPLTVIKGTWELLQSGFVQEEGKLMDCRRRIGANLAMLELLKSHLCALNCSNCIEIVAVVELYCTTAECVAVISASTLGKFTSSITIVERRRTTS